MSEYMPERIKFVPDSFNTERSGNQVGSLQADDEMGWYLAAIEGDVKGFPGEAIARRLVASWNFCRKLTMEDLLTCEINGLRLRAEEDMDEVTAEDRLETALKRLSDLETMHTVAQREAKRYRDLARRLAEGLEEAKGAIDELLTTDPRTDVVAAAGYAIERLLAEAKAAGVLGDE